MCVERLCRKGKGHRYELIAGEVLFGLTASAMLLCAVLIPFEEDAMYVKYIFYGIFAVAAVFALVTVAAHVRFEKLPAFLLERADADFLRDNYNDTAIRLIDISEVAYKYYKDKYGREYSFGTLVVTTDSRTYRIKYAEDLREAKDKIDDWVAERKARGI